MNNSSLKLAGAVILGVLVLFIIYAGSGAVLGVPISKVGYTFIRYVALFLTASLILWVAGKFVAQYNSGWFLQIILVGMASVFFAWIGIVASSGNRTQTVAGQPPAPRTVKQFENFGAAEASEPPAVAVPTAASVVTGEGAKTEFDLIMQKYNLPDELAQFDEGLYTSSSKVYEVVPAKFLNVKNKNGETVKIDDADMFKIINHFVNELRKREEAKASKEASKEASIAPPAPEPPVAKAEVPATESAPSAAPEPAAAVVAVSDDPAKFEAVYKKKCSGCHSLSANAGKMKQKWMRSADKTKELVLWMQRLAKQDRSKAISDAEVDQITAFIRSGNKLY
ncbi:MAG: c-type cytochrome [Chlorobiales bacterium]